MTVYFNKHIDLMGGNNDTFLKVQRSEEKIRGWLKLSITENECTKDL